jgi:hypothetical protein
MKIRTLLGLTVIGTALYAHKRNGGEFTVESMKKSLNDLWSGIQGKAGDVKARAAQLADEIPDKMKGVADSVRSGATSAATSAATGAKNALGPTPGKPAEPASPARSAADERYGGNGPGRGGIGRGR